jgi:predicted Zn-dependent protease
MPEVGNPRIICDDIKLPDMGSPADAVLSKSDEARLGRAIMAQIRQSGSVVEDPIVTEYINEVGSRIVANVNDGTQSFKFFVIAMKTNLPAFWHTRSRTLRSVISRVPSMPVSARA